MTVKCSQYTFGIALLSLANGHPTIIVVLVNRVLSDGSRGITTQKVPFLNFRNYTLLVAKFVFIDFEDKICLSIHPYKNLTFTSRIILWLNHGRVHKA